MKEDFKGQVFFCHGKTNSCGVLTVDFCRILILNVSINDSEQILIKYNANAEKDQIDVLNNMFVLLENFDTNPRKTANYDGQF